MSMYSLLCQNAQPTVADIEDAFQGTEKIFAIVLINFRYFSNIGCNFCNHSA